MRIIYFSFFVLFFIVLFTNQKLAAQPQLIVTLNNSNIETFALTDIRSIKFVQQTMTLFKNNGSVSSWSISDIDNYRFEGVSGINEQEQLIGKLEVFPNPASSQAVISFSSPINQRISIEVVDLLGKKQRDVYSGNHFGTQSYTWQVDIPKGIYVCRVSTENGIVTKSLIIQ